MMKALNIQGRQLNFDDLSTIRNLITDNPSWHRTRISQELCQRWQWMNEKGQFKDIAARSLLRKLDSMGLIKLPAPVRSANNKFRNRPVKPGSSSQEIIPVQCKLSDLQPIRVHQVETAEEAVLFRGLLQQHHYLGYNGCPCHAEMRPLKIRITSI